MRMPKNIVMCLDGTNNQLKRAINTNVVRLFAMLDLKDPTAQVGYYDPGVGTFSSPSAWTPVARTASRYAGLMFGAGLRQNLGEAYTYLMNAYEPGDKIYVFGFSRGAYTARALTGMLDVFGIFRPGSENLVPYAVSAYARQEAQAGNDEDERARQREFFEGLRVFATTHAVGREGHTVVCFVGLWDTVKAAGTVGRQLRWPFTRQLPHAQTIRHAVSIDEARRPFVEYLVTEPSPQHLRVCKSQDLVEVWFAGVHSDVGGMFAEGTRLSDIALKWMADEAVAHGLLVRRKAYADASKLEGVDPSGPIHKMNVMWKLLGPGGRKVPPGELIHASVQERLAVDESYDKRLPRDRTFVDPDWRVPRPFPQPSKRELTVGPAPAVPADPTPAEQS
jgi:uncharacterized protein (DUF2235 family)